VESPSRIEPTRLEAISERLADTLAEVTRFSAQLSQRLHPRTAGSLAELLLELPPPDQQLLQQLD
jgi:hypothetical protein